MAAAAPPAKGKPAPAERKRIRVRATKLGYYDHKRRRVGDVFTCYEDEFSDDTKERADGITGWMERAPRNTPERETGAQAALNQEYDEERRSRIDAARSADQEVI